MGRLLCGMTNSETMSIRAFQQLIRDRYFETDCARGSSGTFMLLMEEVGELATALHANRPGATPTPEEKANLSEEFGDVLAWLCTMANITGVDLTEAIRKYTESGGVEGVKG